MDSAQIKQQRTSFLWAWNHDQPTEDKLMTRPRLAKLLRAWRSHKGYDHYTTVRATTRNARERAYLVTVRGGSSHTVVVRREAV